MQTNLKLILETLNHSKFKGWTVCVVALFSFALGSLLAARVTNVERVKAANNRAFELMIYHTVPGKVPALESIFQDVSNLQAKHDLDVVGYWVPTTDDHAWANTFVYLVAHTSQEDAKKNGTRCTPTRRFQSTGNRLHCSLKR
jgi:glyoxylate carboligase